MFRKKNFCKAPFVNIYVDAKGNVTPCCFNRKDVYGNIYNQHIDEIWNSKTAQKLRQLFKNKQFPENCKICKNAIESKNYYNSGLSVFSKFNAKKPIIQSIDLELSYKCNINCIMCYLHSDNYDLTPEQENLILLRLKPLFNNLKRAQFYGGEPLIIPIYYKIWNAIIESNPNCFILIQTNGTLINEEIKNLAKKGKFIFNVSLDAVSQELLSKIRRGSQLQIIINNLKIFKSLSRKQITLAITPMLQNWKEVPELIRFANKNGYQVFFNSLITPKKMALWYMSSKDLEEVIKHYKRNKPFIFNYASLVNYIKFKDFIKHIKSLYQNSLKRPNYNDDELEKYSELLYFKIKELLPKYQNYQKQILILKIKEYLYLHSYEEAIKYIKQMPNYELEKSIDSLLERE